MTDSEIIKALECCIGFDSCEERQCPMAKECDKDIDSSYKYALDLINRQKAEIERLKNDVLAKEEEYNDMLEQRNSVEEHLEKVLIMLDQLKQDIAHDIKLAKAEAYKECIGKAKEIIDLIVDLMFDDSISKCQLPSCHKPSSIPCENEICIQENKEYWHGKLDNLLKEKVGDKE